MKLVEIGGTHPQILFYSLHDINKFYLVQGGAQFPAMLMRTTPTRSSLRHALGAIARQINSRFDTWRRRQVFGALDARQLADIGVARVDGDYVPLSNPRKEKASP
jgi:hypothetical protein